MRVQALSTRPKTPARWGGESLCSWPSAFADSLTDDGIRDASSPTPFGNRERESFVRQQMARPLVLLLLAVRRPAAVLRAVMTVIVDAVNGVCVTRSATHVSNKSRKRFAPSVAHCNSTTAVVGELFVSRAETAAAHRLPHPILGYFAQPVLRGCRNGTLQTVAAARNRSPGAKRLCGYGSSDATVAFTQPVKDALRRSTCVSNDKKPPEPFAGEVLCLRGQRTNDEFSHGSLLHREVVVGQCRRVLVAPVWHAHFICRNHQHNLGTAITFGGRG